MGKRYNASNETYSLVLPDEWEHKTTSSCIAFYNPNDGRGAITISTMRSPTGTSADPDVVIRNFIPGELLTSGDFRLSQPAPAENSTLVSYAEYTLDESCWRVWVFARGALALISAYNCRIDAKGTEDAAVDSITESIRLQ